MSYFGFIVLSNTSLPLLSRHTFQLHLISLNLLEIFLCIQILAYIAIDLRVSCVFQCFVFVFWEDEGLFYFFQEVGFLFFFQICCYSFYGDNM